MSVTIHESGDSGKTNCSGPPQENLGPNVGAVEAPQKGTYPGDLVSAHFRHRILERALELSGSERSYFVSSVFGDDSALHAEYDSRLADAMEVPSDFLSILLLESGEAVGTLDRSPLEKITMPQNNGIPDEQDDGDASVIIQVGAIAFLQTMWSLLWTAFRHPFTTSYIDIATGAVVEPTEDDVI